MLRSAEETTTAIQYCTWPLSDSKSDDKTKYSKENMMLRKYILRSSTHIFRFFQIQKLKF